LKRFTTDTGVKAATLIDELFREMLDRASRINDPFEQSFFALVHIPYLQPFDDVNKRVSRLAANIPLLKQNFCPLTFLGVPQRELRQARSQDFQ
jgi:Fic family protein